MRECDFSYDSLMKDALVFSNGGPMAQEQISH